MVTNSVAPITSVARCVVESAKEIPPLVGGDGCKGQVNYVYASGQPIFPIFRYARCAVVRYFARAAIWILRFSRYSVVAVAPLFRSARCTVYRPGSVPGPDDQYNKKDRHRML